jgi:hypothetical protein
MSRKKKKPNTSKVIKTKRRLAYKSKSYANPYFRRKRRKRMQGWIVNIPWRLKIILLSIGGVLVFFVWLIFLSPLFSIKYIRVEINAQENNNIPNELRIKSEDVKAIVRQQLESYLYSFIPQKNLFLFSGKKLNLVLRDHFSYKSITINKKPLHTLNVSLEEIDYAFVWVENEKYYYSDINGRIIAETSPLEITNKQYPLIDNRGTNRLINEQINYANFNYIIKLFSALKTIPDFNFDRFVIDDEADTVKLLISGGPEIYFDSKDETEYVIDKQINKLKVVIYETLKNDLANKKYIDLRFGERVFIQ